MSSTISLQVRYTYGAFLSGPLQNKLQATTRVKQQGVLLLPWMRC